ncbi:MAG: ATP-binding protein [Acidobacteriota bacterium]
MSTLTEDLERCWHKPRWQLALWSFLLGAGYTGISYQLGIEFRLGERDVTLPVSLVIEISFAAFGYLWGLAIEARRRERRRAEAMEQRMRESAEQQLKLAHTEKLAALGELASTVAHEFRNPLAILRTMAQNLAEELPGDAREARRSSDGMIEEIDRLARVTSKLMNFARPLALERRAVLAGELAGKVRDLAQEGLGHSAREVRVAGPRDLDFEADPDLVCQALLGLVENALTATSDGSRVDLSWRREASQVVFEVRDFGPGIAPEDRERVFEPFYTTRPDGHGLGLPVARQIARAHGGHLEAGGTAAGAVFRLSLPAEAAA